MHWIIVANTVGFVTMLVAPVSGRWNSLWGHKSSLHSRFGEML
jgi:hypothetical protein